MYSTVLVHTQVNFYGPNGRSLEECFKDDSNRKSNSMIQYDKDKDNPHPC